MFSCNVGAKQGMDRTLIPSAIKAGAVLRDMCTVQTVEPIAGGYEVRSTTDAKDAPLFFARREWSWPQVR